MAKLRCVRHNRRVQVIDIGTDGFLIPLTVHRNGGKRNDVCDSRTVTIDGEKFTPQMVLDDDWSDSVNDSGKLAFDNEENERELWFGTAANPIL